MKHRCPHPLYHCTDCAEEVRLRIIAAFTRAFWQALGVGALIVGLAYAGVLRVLWGGR